MLSISAAISSNIAILKCMHRNPLMHSILYYTTLSILRQRPYSLNLILKSKPNILSAKHYYFSFLNKCYWLLLCLCPKSSRTTTYMIFQSTDKLLQNIKTEQLQLQSSMCKSSFYSVFKGPYYTHTQSSSVCEGKCVFISLD